MFGVKSAAPIVLTPQACALALGAVVDTVVPRTSPAKGDEEVGGVSYHAILSLFSHASSLTSFLSSSLLSLSLGMGSSTSHGGYPHM